MGLVLANNVSSLNAQQNLTRSSNNLAKSVERLSSGLKINRGADGPAALVISEKQRAQIAGLEQAIENSEKAVSLVQTAEGALNEINSLLVKVRSLALDSANAGVNDADALAANQAEISNALDTINRIANNTQFGTKKLLDGSAGVTGTATDADVTVLKATSDTAAGTYSVTVDTVAERAYVDTTTALAAGTLAADETLTVNGVSISLNEGLTRDEVKNRINEFTSQTGVVAEDDGAGTGIRLRTEAFGSDASISVVSNQSGANSAGFTTSVETDTGVNAVATIGSNQFTGVGNVITADTGVTKGLTVALAVDPADSTLTVSGAQGNVSVTNNSLQFQVGPNANQTASIAVDRVNPSSLGVGVAGNQVRQPQ